MPPHPHPQQLLVSFIWENSFACYRISYQWTHIMCTVLWSACFTPDQHCKNKIEQNRKYQDEWHATDWNIALLIFDSGNGPGSEHCISLLSAYLVTLPAPSASLISYQLPQWLVSPLYFCKFFSFPWVTHPTFSHSPSNWKTPTHPSDAHLVDPFSGKLCSHASLSELVPCCTLIIWSLFAPNDHRLLRDHVLFIFAVPGCWNVMTHNRYQ